MRLQSLQSPLLVIAGALAIWGGWSFFMAPPSAPPAAHPTTPPLLTKAPSMVRRPSVPLPPQIATLPVESNTAPALIPLTMPPIIPPADYIHPARIMKLSDRAPGGLAQISMGDLTTTPSDQQWIRDLLVQNSMEPTLAQRSQDPKMTWDMLSEWGSPQWFFVEPKNHPTPLVTPTYSLGLQLRLGGYLTHRLDVKNRPPIHVFSVAQDSPAWRAGIRQNDIVISYNQVPAEQVNWLKTFQSFQDSAADFVIQDASGQKRALHLEPELSTDSAELWSINDETAVLRIRSFNVQTPKRVEHLLRSAARMFPGGVKTFILDLRAPCGELSYLQNVAWLFLGDTVNPLAMIHTRTTSDKPFQAKRPEWLTDFSATTWAQRQSFQILVSQSTGLTGEILAQALVTSKRGTLFGSRTLGNPYHMVTFSLPHGPLGVELPAEKLTVSGSELPLSPSQPFKFNDLSKFYREHGGAF